jgi:hypothetical protein
MTELLVFNGIDGADGGYRRPPPLPPEQGEGLDPAHIIGLQSRNQCDPNATFEPVIFAHDAIPTLKAAHKELLDHHKAQVARQNDGYYRHSLAEKGYCPARNYVSTGMATRPKYKVPYYWPIDKSNLYLCKYQLAIIRAALGCLPRLRILSLVGGSNPFDAEGRKHDQS